MMLTRRHGVIAGFSALTAPRICDAPVDGTGRFAVALSDNRIDVTHGRLSSC